MKANVLRIGTTGSETTFLSERELPPCARLSFHSDEDLLPGTSSDSISSEGRGTARHIPLRNGIFIDFCFLSF